MTEKSNSTDNCRICQYISGVNIDRDIDKPWLENSDYAAFISQGAFIDGWSIIVPKYHIINMEYEFKKKLFWEFVLESKRILEDTYGNTILFEHGPNRFSSTTGCGTDHAHIHLVPVSLELDIDVFNYRKDLQWRKIVTSDIESKEKEYLFFSDESKTNFEKGYFTIVDEPISQFFRKILASKLGIPHLYDYKVNHFTEKSSISRKFIDSKICNLNFK